MLQTCNFFNGANTSMAVNGFCDSLKNQLVTFRLRITVLYDGLPHLSSERKAAWIIKWSQIQFQLL